MPWVYHEVSLSWMFLLPRQKKEVKKRAERSYSVIPETETPRALCIVSTTWKRKKTLPLLSHNALHTFDWWQDSSFERTCNQFISPNKNHDVDRWGVNYFTCTIQEKDQLWHDHETERSAGSRCRNRTIKRMLYLTNSITVFFYQCKSTKLGRTKPTKLEKTKPPWKIPTRN